MGAASLTNDDAPSSGLEPLAEMCVGTLTWRAGPCGVPRLAARRLVCTRRDQRKFFIASSVVSWIWNSLLSRVMTKTS